MPQRLDIEEIRRYWTGQVLQHGQSSSASWSDRAAIEIEIREITKRLRDGDRVLDIGCANGYSTIQYALQRQLFIRGVDYIPAMIAQARARLSEAPALNGRVEFDIDDITGLREEDNRFDSVIVTRVLINLGDWARQKTALAECARILRPEGALLLSEATVQGWTRLNAFRQEWGLEAIPMPPFNLYLEEDKVVEAVAPELELIELVNFASTYYVGSRVLKPLLIRALGADIDVADPEMHWNRWFSQLPAWGDYGTQKLFVFRKRGRR